MTDDPTRQAPLSDVPSSMKYVSTFENTGYGIAAKRYMRGLLDIGVELTWTPMVGGMAWGLGYQPFAGKAVGDKAFDSICNADVPYNSVIVHTVPEYFPHWIALEPGKQIIGLTVWETDVIPKHWKPLLNAVDRLMVPCRWNREVFRDCGVTTPISVIPHVIDNLGPSGGGSPRPFAHPGIRDSDTVFYTIGTWTPRKALSDTLEAYLSAFSSNDAVVLVIKTSKEDFSKPRFKLPGRFIRQRFASVSRTVRQIVARHQSPARVIVIDDEVSEDTITALHRRGDCFVSLCHGEGWGLGAFDAGVHGNPVIMTGYGGQLDYLPPSLAYLVDYHLAPVEYVRHFSSYTPDQHWAQANVSHGASLMRRIFENQSEARARGTALRSHILKHFDAAKICRLMARDRVAT